MIDCYTIGGEDFEDYNPFSDGYNLKYVTVDGKLYYGIDRETKNVILHEPPMVNDIFIYPPHVLCGTDEVSGSQNYLILGTLLKDGNNQEIQWFKNNERFISGIGLSAIKIHEDGVYTCSVSIDSEDKVLFPQVSVTVPDFKDTGQVKSLSVNHTQTIKHKMEPMSAIVSKSSTPLLVSKDKQLSFQTQSEQLFSYVVVSESENKVEPCFEPCHLQSLLL